MVDKEAHKPPELIEIKLSLQQTHHYEMEYREKDANNYLSHDVYIYELCTSTYVIVMRSMLKGMSPIVAQKSRSMSRRILNSTSNYGLLGPT